MQPDPRELVARLDALEAKDYMRFARALATAYPTLRAAVLRVADLEAALRALMQRVAETALPQWDPGSWDAIAQANRALTAPQGEERGA